MKRAGKKIAFFWGIVLAVLVSAASVLAEGVSVVQTDTTDDRVILFIKNAEDVQTATMQIGVKLCQDVIVKEMSDIEDCYIDTVLLVDNSLSISEKNREKTKEALKKLVAVHAENERFCVVTFGESVDGNISFSDDYQNLTDRVDHITYANQDTYVIDALYQVIETVMNQDDGNLKRIVIASDGVDDNIRGYTKNELLKLMDENLCPVYSLASLWEKVPEGVENMFEFSRRTNAEYFLLDDYEDVSEIADAILRDSQLYVVSGMVPQEEMDGGRKNVTVILSTGSGEQKVSKEIEMPFADMTKLEQTETETKTAPETETKSETLAESESEIETETGTQRELESESEHEAASSPELNTEKETWLVYLLAGLLGICGMVIFILIFVWRKSGKRKRPDSFEPKPEATADTKPEREEEKDTEETRFMDENEDSEMTEDIWNRQKSWTVTLTPSNESGKQYRYMVSDKITMGKSSEKCQIQLNDPYISRQHCELFIQDERLYIRDLESKNGTYVNDHRVRCETEIFNNDVIRLGGCSLKIEIVPPSK